MANRRNRKRAEQPGPAGFLVVDKPPSWTSHDVVDAARRWLGTRRVGHLGTLDPQATGVLPLAVREATKLIPYLDEGDKSYRGVVRLGIETDTLDAEGAVVRQSDQPAPTEADLRKALRSFKGEISQVPPMYSAVKQGGVPLHRLARKGEEVEREPKKIQIHRIELLRYEPPEVEIEVDCSPGTYVRVLAADLGSQLGCGAHLQALRRFRSGGFDLSQALEVEEIEREVEQGRLEALLLAPIKVLGLPVFELTREAQRRVENGGDVSPGVRPPAPVGERVAAIDAEGRLAAIMEVRPDRRLWPVRVLPAT